jgi:hypothetical protein
LKKNDGTILDKYEYCTTWATSELKSLAPTPATWVTIRSIGQLTNANSSVNSEDRGYKYDTAWNLTARTTPMTGVRGFLRRGHQKTN